MSLLQDLRFAFRLIAKARWFTAVAVAALSLGIGVNATVFTLVNAVLTKGARYYVDHAHHELSTPECADPRSVVVFDSGTPRNAHSHALHGYLTRDGIPPSEFLKLAREEIAAYRTVQIRDEDRVDE